MEKNIKSFIIKSYSSGDKLLEIPIQLKKDSEYSIPYDCFIFKFGDLNISYDPGGKYLRHFYNPSNSDNDTIHFIKYKYHSVDKFTYLLSIKSSGIFRENDVIISFKNSEILINKDGNVLNIIEEIK